MTSVIGTDSDLTPDTRNLVPIQNRLKCFRLLFTDHRSLITNLPLLDTRHCFLPPHFLLLHPLHSDSGQPRAGEKKHLDSMDRHSSIHYARPSGGAFHLRLRLRLSASKGAYTWRRAPRARPDTISTERGCLACALHHGICQKLRAAKLPPLHRVLRWRLSGSVVPCHSIHPQLRYPLACRQPEG